MFRHRHIQHLPGGTDPDGVKLYTITPADTRVDTDVYLPRLAAMKRARPVAWRETPAFAICHDGATARYLTLGWWGDDNEMFVAVAARTGEAWVEDPGRYSFCLWDMEVMWHERNAFVRHMYGARADLDAYRADGFVQARPLPG